MRVNECGHTDRKYWARGMCKVCYDRDYYSRPDVKAKKAAWKRDYYSRNKDKVKAQQRAYSIKPEGRARMFAARWGIEYGNVLPWFQSPIESRSCWMCGVNGPQLVLDHDHMTRKIRGWSHQACNLIEGMVMKSDNPSQLLASLRKLVCDGV